MELDEIDKVILSFLKKSVVKKKIRNNYGLRKYHNYVVINKIGDEKRVLLNKNSLLVIQSLVIELLVKTFTINDMERLIKITNQHIKTNLI